MAGEVVCAHGNALQRKIASLYTIHLFEYHPLRLIICILKHGLLTLANLFSAWCVLGYPQHIHTLLYAYVVAACFIMPIFCIN